MDIDEIERRAVTEADVARSIKQTEEHGPCNSPNPALVCFAQSLLPTAQSIIKESDTVVEGLITLMAETLSQGITLGQHSGEWAVLAKQEFATSLHKMGFIIQEYPGEEESVLRAYFMAHPLDHFNQEQDVDKEKNENERAHLQEVDAAYEAGKAASE